ncbi:MAG: aminomethyl-transferring glycine dehydrogenase subunit GcvPB [Candidatus Heimdallarchaeota archaeon]|nr:MAG: aminomethyl-transferring glycine dehydrogenase subunit GcvPB [Candidatus Heimdallarchaeota archaeon]
MEVNKLFRQTSWKKTLIFEQSSPGRIGHEVETLSEIEETSLNRIMQKIPPGLLRQKQLGLPEVSELCVVRHFTRLSQMNYGVDSGFYPLGSCTMKYNPKICDLVTTFPEAQKIHPYQDPRSVQGSLQIMHELAKWLAELSGMKKVTLQPAAGAHGEYTGIMIVRKYHQIKGNLDRKREIIVPDSAHGTNPATVSMCGFETVVIPSNEGGCVDIEALRSTVSERTAGIMLTNPNTLGRFEPDIEEITRIIHEVDGLAYYDGANFNAIMGKVRPGDMGFDIVHFNLHKTFATPHGGGGPGAGPVGVVSRLEPFLPIPTIDFDPTTYEYFLQYDHPHSIGKVRSYYGNFSIILRAYAYILRLGYEGLKAVSDMAVLNANYMKTLSQKIKGFTILYGKDSFCMHEFVLSAKELLKEKNISALDVSKFIIDHGFHPPTIYFPLIVPEALMIEPTESESKKILDEFIDILKEVSHFAYTDQQDSISEKPLNASVGRIDDVKAARQPILSYRMLKQKES